MNIGARVLAWAASFGQWPAEVATGDVTTGTPRKPPATASTSPAGGVRGSDTFGVIPSHRDLTLCLEGTSMDEASVRAKYGAIRIPRPRDVEAVEALLPHGVVLRGIYGSGKSSVLDEIARRAADRKRHVIRLTGQEVPAAGIQGQLEDAVAKGLPVTLIVDEFKMMGDPSKGEAKALIESIQRNLASRQCEVMVVLHEGREPTQLARVLGLASVRLRPLPAADVKVYLGMLSAKFGVAFTPEAENALVCFAVTPQQLHELLVETLSGPVQKAFGVSGTPEQWTKVWTRKGEPVPVTGEQVQDGLRRLHLPPELLRSFEPRALLRLLLEPSVRPTTAEGASFSLMETYGIAERQGDGFKLRETAFAWAIRNALQRDNPDWQKLGPKGVAEILGRQPLGAEYKALAERL